MNGTVQPAGRLRPTFRGNKAVPKIGQRTRANRLIERGDLLSRALSLGAAMDAPLCFALRRNAIKALVI
jgi:hypothetical protein